MKRFEFCFESIMLIVLCQLSRGSISQIRKKGKDIYYNEFVRSHEYQVLTNKKHFCSLAIFQCNQLHELKNN